MKIPVTAARFPTQSIKQCIVLRYEYRLAGSEISDGDFARIGSKSRCLPASNGVYFCQLPNRALIKK
jgi:hypothetical protein